MKSDEEDALDSGDEVTPSGCWFDGSVSNESSSLDDEKKDLSEVMVGWKHNNASANKL
jgi:hypothetical protein